MKKRCGVNCGFTFSPGDGPSQANLMTIASERTVTALPPAAFWKFQSLGRDGKLRSIRFIQYLGYNFRVQLQS